MCYARTPLHLAAAGGHSDCVRVLLGHAADPFLGMAGEGIEVYENRRKGRYMFEDTRVVPPIPRGNNSFPAPPQMARRPHTVPLKLAGTP